MTLDELDRLVASKNHLVRLHFALHCQANEHPTYCWDAGVGGVVLDEFDAVFVSLGSAREALLGFAARAETEHKKPRLDRASVRVIPYSETDLDGCDALDEDIPDALQLTALKEGFVQVMDAILAELAERA